MCKQALKRSFDDQESTFLSDFILPQGWETLVQYLGRCGTFEFELLQFLQLNIRIFVVWKYIDSDEFCRTESKWFQAKEFLPRSIVISYEMVTLDWDFSLPKFRVDKMLLSLGEKRRGRKGQSLLFDLVFYESFATLLAFTSSSPLIRNLTFEEGFRLDDISYFFGARILF